MKSLTLGEVTVAALLQATVIVGGVRPAVRATCSPPIVGRRSEIEGADAAVAAMLGRRVTVVVLSGEPGIGKTRLAEEIAARAAAGGARVLWGRCWETGGAGAFWPWIQVLRQYARSVDAGELADAFGSGTAYVSRLVPELAAASGGDAPTPNGATLESEHARFALLDALSTIFARAAKRRPLVLVLDDLHAADLPSLHLLRFVAHGPRDVPLLVIATHRDAELRRRADAAAIIGEVGRGAVTLALNGLGDAAVRDLLAAELGIGVPESAIPLLQAATDGNPFLIEEVARVIAAAGTDRIGRDEHALRLPARGRELIRRRLDLLSAEARASLRVASLVGQEFSLRLLAAVARHSEDAVLERLREASDDGLIVGAGPGGARHRFRHALIREVLTDEIAPAERLALHRAIGEAIETIQHPALEPVLDQLSHHFVRAAPAGDWGRAVRYASAAGEHALAMLAYEDAAVHFDGALDALAFADQREEARRCELLLALATCRLKSANLAAAQAACRRAADIARALGRSDLLGRAALGFAPWSAYGRTSDSGAALLEEALAAQADADGPLRAQLLARLAHVLEGMGARAPRRRALELGREALAMARRLGEPRTLARALFVGRWVDWAPASFTARVDMTEEMLSLAERLRDRELAVMAEGWRVVDCLEAGDAAAMDAAIRRHAALAGALKQPEHQWWSAVWWSMRAITQGRYDEGEERCRQAFAIGEQVERENAYLVAHVQHAQVMIDRGQLEAALAVLDGVVAERREILENDPVVICRRMQFLAELGRLADARQEFERLAADDFAAVLPDMRYAVNLASLAVACAALDDRRRAPVLYELLQPAAGRSLVFGPAMLSAGPAGRYQGLLAGTLGRFDLARRHFEDALVMSRRMGWLPLVARIQCDYAAMLLRRGRGHDRRAARPLLDEAADTAARLGMELVACRAGALRGECRLLLAGRDRMRDTDAGNLFRRDGEYWTIVYGGRTCRLRHSRGLHYLAQLLRVPGSEIHALDLEAPARGRLSAPAEAFARTCSIGPERDAGTVIDRRARMDYRRRLREIEAELAAAEADNDPGRAERLRAEHEALEHELRRAVDFRGRLRRAVPASERARLNVTRAIRKAIVRIDASHPPLGRHLMRCVRTGTFCAYHADPRLPRAWTVAT